MKDTLPVGVVIECRLDEKVNDAAFADWLQEMFDRHHLLIFQNQQLTPGQHIAVCGMVGPVPADIDKGAYFIATDGRLGKGDFAFHSDLAFDPHPHLGASLYATAIDPPQGSSTAFVDCAAAYESIPKDLKVRIADLHALHVFPTDTSAERSGRMMPLSFPRAVHPVVWNHPRTGVPVLYINGQATVRIVGLEDAESDRLIEELLGYVRSAPTYEHKWSEGDVLIWDNRALQHARGTQDHMKTRTLHRVIIDYLSFETRYASFLTAEADQLNSLLRD